MRTLADPEKAAFFPKFFKAGPGQYGEGDRFLGVTVPAVRQTARELGDLALPELEKLLASPYNEARLLGLILLEIRYDRRTTSTAERERLHRFYLKHRARVNNWNLVDSSAPTLVGTHLCGAKPGTDGRELVYRLARSRSLWDRRIAIVATLDWIRRDQLKDTLSLCELLLDDDQDLMHKACGWMLREVGKRDELTLTDWLDRHAPRMPRTMLRYAIERLSTQQKRDYLAIKRVRR